MAILVGIDEAGYGPHLGPLVVSAAALRLPGDLPPNPRLWFALRGHVCRRPRTRTGRLVICDSKDAYAARGPALLERATLGFLEACGQAPETLSALLAQTDVPAGASENASDAAGPWHRPKAMTLPAHTTAADVARAAGHLTRGLAHLGGRCECLWINVASPPRFNRLIETTRNKATALFGLAADLLNAAHRQWPADTIHVTMDCHGGRHYYAPLLAETFPMQTVRTLEESPGLSRYDLVRTSPGRQAAPICFTIAQRCEQRSLATALASMAAKYVRELHMRQLNAYFQALVPGLRATAGYGRDAWRFLDDVAPARNAQGVPDATILRCR